jgi:hypothetical protein
LFFIKDGDALHPEWIESMRATLLYRGEHDLGTVEFDCSYATGDSDVQAMWMHPAHVEDLSIRFQGTVVNCGDVDFTVQVGQESAGSTVFTPQFLEGVDGVAPRTEYTAYGSTTHQLDPAVEEVDVLDTNVVLTLMALDFLSENEPLVTGNGPIDYTGGGNRLLPSLDNDGTFVLQPVNALPHGINGYTLTEAAGSNLLTNTTFESPTGSTNEVPAGYSLTASNSVTVLPYLEQNGDIWQFRVRTFGSGPYVGPKGLVFSYDAAVPVTPGAPVTWSVLARIGYYGRTEAPDIPEPVVKLDTLRLVVSFRDAGDVEISSQTANFNPLDLFGETFILLQNVVQLPPFGTAAVRVRLELESIEESDDINLYLMAPQVEEAQGASSRMVGAGVVDRYADTLRIPQAENLEFRQGTVQISFASNYQGAPVQDACLFDSRTGGFNGFALYHLPNGRLRFVVAGPSASVLLESDPQSFVAGGLRTVSVSWGEGHRSIWLDGEELVSSDVAVVLPQVMGAWIYWFSTAELTDRFSGVLTGVEIQREPQG